jgi:methylenetetrahydrofolate reductase (NADPH)
MKTDLAEALHAGRLTLSVECLPPRGSDASAVRKLAGALPARVDAVVVADNPHGNGGSALACAAILAGEKVEPVLSVITRDRNRIALQSDVLGAASVGVRSVLCLSGEHQSLGADARAAGVYDIDPVQLILGLKAMCDKGVDFAGKPLESKPKLLLGAAAHPYLRPMALNLMGLRKKVAAGAGFFITQAVFDVAGFAEWMDAVRAAGIDKQAAIIASVLPLVSVEQAKALQEKKSSGIGPDVVNRLAGAADIAREGIAIAAEAARKVKAIAGVRGIHILSGGPEAVARIVEEAGLAQA